MSLIPVQDLLPSLPELPDPSTVEQKGKMPFISLVQATSDVVKSRVTIGNHRLSPGDWYINSTSHYGDSDGIEFVPIGGVQVQRELQENPQDFKSRLCYSNDGKVPMAAHFGGTAPLLIDKRTNKSYGVDLKLESDQDMVDDEGIVHIGGCVSCGLSQWLTTPDGKKLPPPCNEKGALLIFIHGFWREGTFTETNVPALYLARSTAYRILTGYKSTSRLDNFRRPFTPTMGHQFYDFFSRFTGQPRDLLAFEDNKGNIVSIDTALTLDYQPNYVGFRTLRLSSTFQDNNKGSGSYVPVVRASNMAVRHDKNSPAYFALVDAMNELSKKGLVEMLGLPVPDRTLRELPATVQQPVEKPVYKDDSDVVDADYAFKLD